MKTPIVDFVNSYAKKDTARLHMPGHKGVSFLGCEKMDITEIRGADELYDAEGIIAESERNAESLFGFGKTVAHNYALLRHLDDFRIFNLPLLVGVSRKSMITRPLGITADAAMNGTTVLNTISLMKGASILRVHDVKEAVEVARLHTLMLG